MVYRSPSIAALTLMFAGMSGAQGKAPTSLKALEEKPLSYRIVALGNGPYKPDGVPIGGETRTSAPALWVSGSPDPPGWRRFGVAAYTVAVPPWLEGGVNSYTSMKFESSKLQIRFNDDPTAQARCNFGKPCLRQWDGRIHSVYFEAAALEDWRSSKPKDGRPWRYFAVGRNQSQHGPILGIEARCSTREICLKVKEVLKTVYLADQGPALRENDRKPPFEPQYASPAAYGAGAHKRTKGRTPRGWRRIVREGNFSIAAPPNLKEEFTEDGHGSAIVELKGKALELTVIRGRYTEYTECTERIPCVRERMTIDGLPATVAWEDWKGQRHAAMEKNGFRWNFSVSIALQEPAGAVPFGPATVTAFALCTTREVCERARAMAATIEIF